MIYMKDPDHRILPRAKKHEPPEIQGNADKLRLVNEKAQELIYRLDEMQAS